MVQQIGICFTQSLSGLWNYQHDAMGGALLSHVGDSGYTGPHIVKCLRHGSVYNRSTDDETVSQPIR